jgi:Low-density lipoprotein receptor repeat class B
MRCLRGANVTQRTVVSERLDNIEGLAYNWMSGLLYFVDAINKRIEVVTVNGTHRKVIIDNISSNNTLELPRAIALYPQKGLVSSLSKQ